MNCQLEGIPDRQIDPPMCDAEDEWCQSCGHEIDIDGHCGCPWPCNVEGCTRPREEGCELCTQHTDEELADCGEK
jgi:hypothetical protein